MAFSLSSGVSVGSAVLALYVSTSSWSSLILVSSFSRFAASDSDLAAVGVDAELNKLLEIHNGYGINDLLTVPLLELPK
jgi:hypothetical protein